MGSLPDDVAQADLITLRPLVAGDAEVVVGLLNDDALRQRLPSAPKACTPAYAAGLIADAAVRWAQGKGVSFAICRNQDQALLGEVSLSLMSREIGIWLGAKYWRCGYGQASLRSMLRFAQSELGVRLVHSIILRDNHASRGLFEKCGFSFAGLHPIRSGTCSVPYLKYIWRQRYQS